MKDILIKLKYPMMLNFAGSAIDILPPECSFFISPHMPCILYIRGDIHSALLTISPVITRINCNMESPKGSCEGVSIAAYYVCKTRVVTSGMRIAFLLLLS